MTVPAIFAGAWLLLLTLAGRHAVREVLRDLQATFAACELIAMHDDQTARAQARYEAHRDAEAAHMARLRDQLDEVWADEEDPRSERERDDLFAFEDDVLDDLDALPIAVDRP